MNLPAIGPVGFNVVAFCFSVKTSVLTPLFSLPLSSPLPPFHPPSAEILLFSFPAPLPT